MRSQAQMVALVAAIAATLGGATTSNVLFLAVDDLNTEIGAFGSPVAVTPNIDALAEDSVIFTHASVQQSVCNPSRSSFLTSRRPDSLRVWDLQACWRTAGGVNATTMPQFFKQHGYVSGGSGKIFHPVYNNHTKTTDDVPYSWTLPYYHPPAASDKQYANLTHTFWPIPGNVTDQLPDNHIIASGIEQLHTVTTDPQYKDKPFFVAVGVHRPHLPFNVPESFWDLYPLSTIPMPKWPYRPHDYGEAVNYGWDPESGPRHTEDIRALNISFPFGTIPLDYGKKMKQAYLAAVSYTDSNIGTVLQALKDTGLYDATTIVFLGDHGFQLAEHAEWGKKTTFDRAVTAPLMIKPAKTASDRPSTAKFDPGFAEPGSAFRRRIGVDREEGAPEESGAEAGARRSETVPTALKRYHETLDAKLTKSSAFVEFAGIYPTLAELSGLPVPPVCPSGSAGMHNTTCVESSSFAGAVRLAQAGSPVQGGQTAGGAPAAAFSQYPHCMHDVNEPGFYGCHDPALPGLQPRYMGYTILAIENQEEWRYTRWVNFTVANASPLWDEVLAEELYHRTADPTEDYNVIADPANKQTAQALYSRLVAGWRAAI